MIYFENSENLSSLAVKQSKRDIGDMNFDRLLETFNREADIPDLLDTEVAVYVPKCFGLLHRGWHRLSVTHVVSFFDRHYNVYIDARLTWGCDSPMRDLNFRDFIELHVAKQNRERFCEIVMREFFCDKRDYSSNYLNDPYFALKR